MYAARARERSSPATRSAGTTREWLVLGVAPRLQLRMTGLVFLVDALLTPIGLLAALAAQDEPMAFLLVLPLAALLRGLRPRARARASTRRSS